MTPEEQARKHIKELTAKVVATQKRRDQWEAEEAKREAFWHPARVCSGGVFLAIVSSGLIVFEGDRSAWWLFLTIPVGFAVGALFIGIIYEMANGVVSD